MSSPSSVIVCGDSLDVLKGLPADGFDSCVTDPPYGLSFMGKAWDYRVPRTELWKEVYRTLKPGAFLLAFFGTRTYHRGVVQIEDAGFEIRDQLGWMYGSGFPKSMDVSKAIDNAAGAEREVIGHYTVGGTAAKGKHKGRAASDADEGSAAGCTKELNITIPATAAAAAQWQGWGTALKPAWEPIVLARKPLIGTVAENVLKHGTGGLNIDGCRVEYLGEADKASATPQGKVTSKNSGSIGAEPDACRNESRVEFERPELKGRFPANVIHDGSEEVMALFPTTKSGSGNTRRKPHQTNAMAGTLNMLDREEVSYGDEGSAARFFYCPKAAKSERGKDNNHPTVKPIELMRYLCRLVTPPGGVVLDPFCGSGTTGIAANAEGFEFGGIELDPAFAELARKRISEAANG